MFFKAKCFWTMVKVLYLHRVYSPKAISPTQTQGNRNSISATFRILRLVCFVQLTSKVRDWWWPNDNFKPSHSKQQHFMLNYFKGRRAVGCRSMGPGIENMAWQIPVLPSTLSLHCLIWEKASACLAHPPSWSMNSTYKWSNGIGLTVHP